MVLTYDGNKYCIIDIDGHREMIKSGYLYSEPGRLNDNVKSRPPMVDNSNLLSVEVDWDEWVSLTPAHSFDDLVERSDEAMRNVCLLLDVLAIGGVPNVTNQQCAEWAEALRAYLTQFCNEGQK